MSLIKGTVGTLAAISLLYGFYEAGYQHGFAFGQEQGKRIMCQKSEKIIDDLRYQLVTGVDGLMKSAYTTAKASLKDALEEKISSESN